MPLPSPIRSFPHADIVSPPDKFRDYAGWVAANGERLFRMVVNHVGSVGGSANAITGVCSPPLLADPANGETFRLVPTAANTGAVTFSPDGRGPWAIRRKDGNPLQAGDLQAGVAQQFWFDASAGYFRLDALTAAEIAALGAAGAPAALWATIGETIISSPVAQVEYTFTAGAYSQILLVASDLSHDDSSNTLVITLRNSTTAIVTMTTASVAGTAFHTFRATFTIGRQAATKVHHGELSGNVGAAHVFIGAVGSHATAPDRVRIAPGNQNLDAGIVRCYGLKV